MRRVKNDQCVKCAVWKIQSVGNKDCKENAECRK